MDLPETYVTHMFFKYGGRPHTFGRSALRASCPVCREGSHWLKKTRLYYFPRQNYLYCHNCVKSWSPAFWIKEVTGWGFADIRKDAIEFCGEDDVLLQKITENPEDEKPTTPSLPHDSINLADESQVAYYKDHDVVSGCIKYIKDRKLNTAQYRAHPYYISLTDVCHKNRLVIPFYDTSGHIIFYQTRTIPGFDSFGLPKYLGKIGAEKSCFNIEKIDYDLPYYFVLEGPIDTMFIKNGIGIGGVKATDSQNEQMQMLDAFGLQRIWVLDNFRKDTTARSQTIQLLKDGETVFFWPDVEYKDLNAWCCAENKNELDWKLVSDQARSGTAPILRM